MNYSDKTFTFLTIMVAVVFVLTLIVVIVSQDQTIHQQQELIRVLSVKP